MHLLCPQNWNDYELIDSGNFEKLERFGNYFLIRTEPQAVWDKKLSLKEWEQQAHVKFIAESSSSGSWKKLKSMPGQWQIGYQIASPPTPLRKGEGSKQGEANNNETLNFKLSLTSFKHIGIFPEQAVNWDYIYETIKNIQNKKDNVTVLNLFAYTGGASLAAKAAGADVVHLDSVKQVVSWARTNMELSTLKDIRWVVEDAMTFVKREVKRGKKYNGIILDPPAYGRGTDGEKWKLEDNINEMMKNVAQLLDEKENFLILNTYSLGFSSMIIENLLYDVFRAKINLETGELFLKAKTGTKLPLGVFGRFRTTEGKI